MTSRVLIVEDHLLLAQLLAGALEGHGIDAAVAASTDPAVLGTQVDADTLVLLDLHLGEGEDGSAYVTSLRAAGARVLVLTGSEDLLAIGRALDAGAIDVLPKSLPFEELVDAVAAASAASRPRDRAARYRLVQAAKDREARRDAAKSVLDRLTPREREVLDSLTLGASAEEIAAAGVVSLATVRTQIHAILGKLGAHSQIAAVARARQIFDDLGWPSHPPA